MDKLQILKKEKELEKNIAKLKSEITQLKKANTMNTKLKESKIFDWPEGSQKSAVQLTITPFLKNDEDSSD